MQNINNCDALVSVVNFMIHRWKKDPLRDVQPLGNPFWIVASLDRKGVAIASVMNFMIHCWKMDLS